MWIVEHRGSWIGNGRQSAMSFRHFFEEMLKKASLNPSSTVYPDYLAAQIVSVLYIMLNVAFLINRLSNSACTLAS